MLFGNFFFLLPFSSDIVIFLLSFGKTRQKTIKNAKKFVTLARSRIFTKQLANAIELQTEFKGLGLNKSQGSLPTSKIYVKIVFDGKFKL